MGKQRKIEIDDRMPCNKFDQYLLPKCKKLEELWPSLIVKALLKLHSYKYLNYFYQAEEVGDLSIIYSLTGYIGERIRKDNLNESIIKI
jgi:hypothetical protein